MHLIPCNRFKVRVRVITLAFHAFCQLLAERCIAYDIPEEDRQKIPLLHSTRLHLVIPEMKIVWKKGIIQLWLFVVFHRVEWMERYVGLFWLLLVVLFQNRFLYLIVCDRLIVGKIKYSTGNRKWGIGNGNGKP